MRFSTFAVAALSLTLAIGAGCSNTPDDGGGSATGGSGSGTGGARSGGSGGGTGGSGSGGSGSGGSGSGGSMSGSGGSGSGGSGSGGMSGGDASSGGVTWTNDIKPIFMAKCGTCHTTTRIGHNLGASYADAMKAPTNKNANACGTAATIGACTILRIKNGSMPAINPKCTGNPAMDSGNSKCLTQAEQDKVQAWVDGGLKE